MNDLSALSKTGNVDRAGTLVAGQKNDVAIAGGQILGDEWSDHVVKVGENLYSGRIIVLSLSTLLESLGYYIEREVCTLCLL